MPSMWVPPGYGSPYQKGDGPVVNSESLKPISRQPVIGVDASVIPGRQRQSEPRSKTMSARVGTMKQLSRITEQRSRIRPVHKIALMRAVRIEIINRQNSMKCIAPDSVE